MRSAPYTVSSTAVQPNANSTYTNVATISAVSPDRVLAARLANAFALVFIDSHKERERLQVAQAEQVVESKMKSFTTTAAQNSSDYIPLEERLRDLQILAATVTGDFGLVAPAVAPTAPFSPRPGRAAVLGFGIVSSLSKRYEPDDLAVVSHPDGRVAEAFRMLRGNLEFVNVDDSARAILVTSCKQGEGKSPTVANLGATLALAGKRVIVIDGDLRRPQMHRYFGLESVAGLSTVLSGQTPLADALREIVVTPEAERSAEGAEADDVSAAMPCTLRVLTSGTLPPNLGEQIASKKFGILLEHLRSLADVVLIDSPAIMAVGDAGALAAVADGLVMLVNIQQVRRPTLRDVCDLVEPLPCRKFGVIVVRERLRADESYRYAYYRYQQA